MFLLKHDNGTTSYLFSGKEYTVGRKSTDIIISDDQSISRKHAVIKVATPQNTITLMDFASKYGTSYNNVKLEPNKAVIVKEKVPFKFGVFESKYSIENIRIVTTGTGLTELQKGNLKITMAAFQGTFLNEWNASCTHLTTQEIVLTIKVLHALIDNKPIVKMEYWEQFYKNVNKGESPPDTLAFKPPIAEAIINSVDLSTYYNRKELFNGKIFVFSNEKMRSKMEEIIKKTGGEIVSWDKQNLNLTTIKRLDLKNTYIFIQSDNQDTDFKSVCDFIRKQGQRTIPLQEIVMAVLLNSCQKDCNPNFNKLAEVFIVDKKKIESQTQVPLAYETENDSQPFTVKHETVVPSSLDNDLESMYPAKRKRSVDDNRQHLSVSNCKKLENKQTSEPQENPVKKTKIDKEKTPTLDSPCASTSQKRKAETSIDVPAKKASLQINPFVVAKKKLIAADNPFANLRVKKEEIAQPKPDIAASADFSYVQSLNNTSSFSSTYKSECDSLSETRWLSRNSIMNETIKIDDSLIEVFEKFRNTVVVEMASTLLRPSRSSVADVSFIQPASGKNFKKFRKVNPMNPQIHIINVSITAEPPSLKGIIKKKEAFDDDDNDDDDVYERKIPLTPRPVVKKQNKRFDF